ncbi:MAG TPA: DUF1684 domain-containing protein [Flavobacterium sp.]
MSFQTKINAEFANRDISPLTTEDFKDFKNLKFYAIDSSFFVTARLVRTPDEKPFKMKTTTDRAPLYIKYGEVLFTLKGKQCKLNIYRNLELAKKEKYKAYLFLPFTDLTSGVDSYGGGRYIDLTMPKTDTIAIDFNTSYNPYCAYNHRYSCPIPPKENDLKVKVAAGVKKFHD